MKLAFKSTSILFLILSLSLTSCNSNQEKHKTQEEHKTHYECPPCGCASDGKISETDGVCPSCGIKLVKKTTANTSSEEFFKPLKVSDETLNVAIFLFHNNQVLDYAGPYDAFVAGGSSFNVYTVGATLEPIITYPNLSVNPQYSINNAPKPDIIIIPAGNNETVNQDARDWILKSAENADYILSVCNGVFLIAELGLLDGLEATSHLSGLNSLEKNFPKINKVHRDRRYVDNGKVITSGGVSAGIDASFYLMSKILGNKRAQAAANSLEYIYWNPENDKY
jgi:transcriptional regulator GlxA family with amidase domain/DNA-directed RNA polymerase subunit RPC12/RpoP